MAAYSRRYDPENPRDAEILLKMLEDDIDEAEEVLDSESDFEVEGDENEMRVEDSESEQSAESSDNEDQQEGYFVGKDGVTRWKKGYRHSKIRSHNIVTQLAGVRGAAKEATSPIEAWSCFVTDAMLDIIVTRTNQYIESVAHNFQRERDAKPTDKVEMKAFLALLYLAGVLKSNRLSLEEMWSTDGEGIEFFRLAMSIKRFKFLIRCLRFDDPQTRVERRIKDNLAPIRELFSLFVENCKENYSLGQNVTIDEKLEAFRGNCRFRQYIPSKPAKYGIKIYALVDARHYYSYNLEVYVGKQPEGEYNVSNKPSDVVKRLVTPIHNTGRNITADNWFTDVELVSYLKEKKLSYVGTIRKNKRQLPTEFVATKRRPENSSLFGFSSDATIVSYVPKKNKNITLISSLHHDDAIDESTGDKRKPEIITFYNDTKSGVDVVDKMCSSYNVARNTRRWPLVVFFSLLNIAGINAQVVLARNGQAVVRRRLFLRELAKQLAMEHLQRRRANSATFPRALQERLNSVNLENQGNRPVPEDNVVQNNPLKRKACVPCNAEKRRRLTNYYCKTCDQALCLQHAIYVCQKCYQAKEVLEDDESA